ncbi:nitrilase-related carbon-nitrogen hydrolase [Saliniramus sp.]|uniref:nitrilase-related carbon-nitrogen hydrolase n=1 Tax=Saliniramus sp. TaxID=2986772 RepID=UPI002BE8858A|nr:nitrilase-related carbon-nitrogen hydrolase [Saliniramus sp.]HMB10632.1 nitrilase-related carbon-nitrogen hydrolase [Saliniramus sp.]
MRHKTLTLALWQGARHTGAGLDDLSDIAAVIGGAAKAGADLLVFPEGYLTGYYRPGLRATELAGVDAALDRLGRLVNDAGIMVVMGTHRVSGRALVNAAIVFDTRGRTIGAYHKRALFGDWERATFEPGTQPLRFDCGGFRVGLAICYDLEFPELIRAEAEARTDLVVTPTALMAPHGRIAGLLPAARALENQIFVAYANRTGREHELAFVGQSCICGPDGAMLAVAGNAPEMLVAQLDRKAIRAARDEASYLEDLGRLRENGG